MAKNPEDNILFESHKIENKCHLDSMHEFKKKVEKLKVLKDAGLLTDEEFNAEKSKLLEMI